MRTPAGASMQMALFLADSFAELSIHAFQAAWNHWLSPSRFQRQLAQLQCNGYLETTRRGHEMDGVIRLTESGRIMALGGRDPETSWRRPWDGRWRVVLFDVPERHRSRRIKLQRQLRSARFGYLQDSVWISPDSAASIAELMREASIDLATLSFLEARPSGAGTDADMVSGAWNFDRINALYTHYLGVLKGAPSAIASDHARRTWCMVEWNSWRRALSADPLLPESLLPQNYAGRRAYELRREKLTRHLRAH